MWGSLTLAPGTGGVQFGSYNTGIGNSGIASTGLFNAGGFNTGVVNAGSYNTGSFNAGQANTGGFNPGSVNTGWLNTGDINTGVANSGDVNTGAFISGNYSNGAFWRGDYQGLLGFSYRPAVLPQTPFLDLTLTGGLGSVVIPAIDIPAIRPEFSANVAIDSFTVPSIPIPQIDLAATTVSVGLGPITVPHLDIPRVPVTLNYLFGSQPGGPLKIGPITDSSTPPSALPLALSQIVIGASSSQGTITAFLANLPFSTPVVTIDEIPLLASITGHSEPVDIFPGGLTIPAMNPLSINLSGGTGAVTIPAITIGEIPLTSWPTARSAPFTSSSTFPPCRGSGIRPVLRRRVSSTPVRVGCRGLGMSARWCRVAGIRLRRRCWVGFGCFQRRHAAFGCAEFRLWHVGAVQHQRVGVGCAGVGVGFG